MIKEKPDRFASTSSAITSTDSVATASITPPPTTSSPATPGPTTAPDGSLNSSALSKSPSTTSTGGGSSGQSPSATKTTTNNTSSNATGINTTNSSTVPNITATASGVSPQSSSSLQAKHSPTHQLSNKEKDGQSSITPTVSALMPTIKDEPISSDSLMGNGEDMCALQADQIKRESESGSNSTQSSTTGNLKDNSSLNSRLSKNGVGTANIIGSTNTGSVAGGYEKANRSPLSEARIKEELTSLSGGPQTCNLSLVKMETPTGSESIDFQSHQQIPPMDQVSNRMSGDGSSPTESNPVNTGASGQPIPSNVMSKQSGGSGMEYMQTQNHIFVFSTSLANKSAEAVMTRQYASIIAYHCAQPGSKKFLEKHPLKQSQFQRQNPAQWLNNISIMKSKSNIRGPAIGGNNSGTMAMQQQSHMSGVGFPTSGSTGSIQDDMMSNPDNDLLSSWDDASSHNIGLDVLSNGANAGPPNTTSSSASIASGAAVASAASLDSTGLDVNNLVPGSPLSGRIGSNNLSLGPIMQQQQQSPTTMVNSGPGSLGSTSPGLGGMQPSLQGVKVPDANLTPQQRQHREEQLAKIKEMNCLLFPEHMPGDCLINDGDPQGNGSGGPPPCKMQQLSAPSGQGGQRGGNVPNMGGGPTGQMSGGPGCTPQMTPNMSPGGPMGGMPGSMGFNNMSMMSGMGGSGTINEVGGPHCGPGGMMHQSNLMGNMGGPGSGPHQQMMGNMNMPHMGGPRAHLSQHQQQQQQQQQQMMSGMNSCMLPMGPGGMMNQKQMMGGPGGQTVQAQMEWNKLQHQFFEERKGDDHRMDGGRSGHMQSERERMIHAERMFQMNMGGPPMGGPPMGGMMPGNRQMSGSIRHPNQQQQFQQHHQQGSRLQGPPPPYHQTQRSASVPIATQSPNPSSPTNNPTSNLSLPSPRAGSALNSPAADPSRQQQPSFKHIGQSPTSIDSPAAQQRPVNHSNPSTPISSHLSPNASLKDLELATSQHMPGKEPNLMPVPSPQQIQYLNAFEGQELTIQKQANTSLKDNNNISGQQQQHLQSMSSGHSDNRLSGSNTPLTPSSSSIEPRFPPTPGTTNPSGGVSSGGAQAGSTFPIPSSPQTPTTVTTNPSSAPNPVEKSQRIGSSGPSPQGSRTPSLSGDANCPTTMSSVDHSSRFPPSSPNMNFSPASQQQSGMKMGNFMDMSPTGKISSDSPAVPAFPSCGRTDNLPLNPNSNVPTPTKTSHFDPISSLAQMSQQLTNNTPSSMNGQQGVGPGMMSGGPFNHGMMPNDIGTMNHPQQQQPQQQQQQQHHQQQQQQQQQQQSDGGPIGPMLGPSGMDCGLGMGMGMPPGQFNSPSGMSNAISGGPNSRSMSPRMSGPMMNYGGPGMMGPGMGPRMMGRPPMGAGGPYNGANIQVKASAPNTIQYLPNRPQVGNSNPRGPPSIEFLQKFTNPINQVDGGKMSNQQMGPFYSNCNQMGPSGPNDMRLGGMNPHMDGGMSDGPMGPMVMSGMPGGPSGHMMMGQGMMMRGIRQGNQGNFMRMPGPPHPHMMSNHPFNGPGGPNDGMFPPGGPNAQMFVGGPKGSPMNAGVPPDTTQPLPPSMGQGGPPFKSSQFIGPTTGDPNYAQQYHNFQQQLYAINPRSQLNNQGHGQNPNQSFFVPK